MSQQKYKNFSDIFSEVLISSARGKDPIHHVLILTYEFDEQQLLNLVCGRTLEEDFELRQGHLKLLSEIRPIVIYDARKTQPFSKLPQFLELHPFKSGAFCCHHSKAYLIVTQKTIRLVLGSFNLTKTGLFKNREVMQSYLWNQNSTQDAHILKEWTDFVEIHYSSRLKASSQTALLPILARLKKEVARLLPNSASKPRSHLLHSGYGESKGLDLLVQRWREWFPEVEPEEMLVVSPFFDVSAKDSGIAGSFLKEFPGIEQLDLITDATVFPNLSQAHFGKNGTLKGRKLFLIPEVLPPTELDRIVKLSAKATKDQVIIRKLHAKMILLRSGPHAIAYMGSANFSSNAWLGKNQELGLVWVVDNPKKLREQIFTNLSVESTNRYSDLPSDPPGKIISEDDEGYDHGTLFPGFIEYVVLASDEENSKVQFRFELNDEGSLQVYNIFWAGIRLEINKNYSQWIDRADFQTRLVGGRNLSFQPKSLPSEIHWFPFQYANEIIADSEALMHPSTLDWLSYYLNPDHYNDLNDDESLPGGHIVSPEIGETNYDEVDRESNCIIAMQGYLNLFSRVEKEFKERMDEIVKSVDKDNDSLIATFKKQIIEPLQGFCRLLEREATSQAPDHLFKLGELKLFIHSLYRPAPKKLHEPINELLKQIQNALDRGVCTDNLLVSYLSFVNPNEVLV